MHRLAITPIHRCCRVVSVQSWVVSYNHTHTHKFSIQHTQTVPHLKWMYFVLSMPFVLFCFKLDVDGIIYPKPRQFMDTCNNMILSGGALMFI